MKRISFAAFRKRRRTATIKFNKMKKFFTLVFSLCLLTVAFAQDGHHRDYNSNRGSGNQSWVQGDQKKYWTDQDYKTTPYSNSDNWKYQSNDGRNEHYSGNVVNKRDGFGDRDDMRGNFDNSRFNGKRFDKGMNNRHAKTYRKKPGLQIVFGFGAHH
jgi:hypothetical protein